LNLDWKMGLEHTYNFLKIYENNVLNRELKMNEAAIKAAKMRNNYQHVYQKEL